MHSRLFVIACFLIPSFALGAGYGPWEFGMTKQQVRAVSEYAPYYEFRNGDLGTKGGPMDGARAPVSFYFANDRLVRVMVALYSGQSFDETRNAWDRAFQHIERHFGAAEVASVKAGPTDLLSAQRALDASGLREGKDTKLQMGASPMPKDRVIWCTVSIVPSVGYWVALNYANP